MWTLPVRCVNENEIWALWDMVAWHTDYTDLFLVNTFDLDIVEIETARVR